MADLSLTVRVISANNGFSWTWKHVHHNGSMSGKNTRSPLMWITACSPPATMVCSGENPFEKRSVSIDLPELFRSKLTLLIKNLTPSDFRGAQRVIGFQNRATRGLQALPDISASFSSRVLNIRSLKKAPGENQS